MFRDKKLIGVPVFTQSGEKLGKLIGFFIDTHRHEIIQYVVSRSSLLSRFVEKELLIHSGQVISLNEKKMVVEDAVILEFAVEHVLKGEIAKTQVQETAHLSQ